MESALICVYIFPWDGHSKQSSDDRIYECARRFFEAERAGDALFPDAGSLAPLPAIVRGQWKKPRFERDIGLRFSVSHSGGFWACDVAREEVGIDIQRITADYHRGIPERFFHPDEHAYLQKNGFADFFKIWTAKESYVKFTGSGIDHGFYAFSVVSNGRIPDGVNGAELRFLNVHPDYCACLCAGRIEKTLCEIGFT